MIYFGQREIALMKMIGMFILSLIFVAITIRCIHHYIENGFLVGGFFAIGSQLYVRSLDRCVHWYRKSVE